RLLLGGLGVSTCEAHRERETGHCDSRHRELLLRSGDGLDSYTIPATRRQVSSSSILNRTYSWGRHSCSAAAQPQRTGNLLIPTAATNGFAAADRNVCPTADWRSFAEHWASDVFDLLSGRQRLALKCRMIDAVAIAAEHAARAATARAAA